MVMRYHWGLGIGHTYSHSRDIPSQQYPAPLFDKNLEAAEEVPCESGNSAPAAVDTSAGDENDNVPEPNDQDPEDPGDQEDQEDQEDQDPEDREDQEGQDLDCDSAEAGCDASDDSDGDYSDRDDRELLELHETYHSD